MRVGRLVAFVWPTIMVASVPAAETEPRGDATASVRERLDSAALLLHAGRARDALTALDAVERVEPDNPWLWFYRGSARAQLGDAYGAMEDYDRAASVLARLDPPQPQLAEAVRRRRADARRQVFGVSLLVGAAYDTNVSFLGSQATDLGLIAGRGDGRVSARFQIDHAPLKDEHQSLALGARAARSRHFSVEEFDFEDYGGSVTYTRWLDPTWEIALRYDADMMYLGNDPFVFDHALTAMLIHHWPRAQTRLKPHRTSLFYRIEARDYRFTVEPAFDRDSLIQAVGMHQSFQLRPEPGHAWHVDIGVGYTFESISTDGSEFDRRVHRLRLGIGTPLVRSWNRDEYLILPDRPLRLRFDATWEIGDYRNASLNDFDGDRRSDLITTLGLVLSQTLLADPDRGDLTVHAGIHWTDAHSSITTRDEISPFTYDKVVYGLQFQWAW